MKAKLAVLLVVLPLSAALPRREPAGFSDESVFVRGLKAGEREKLLYVWTSDADGKNPDFVTVIDADSSSPTYGTVVSTAPTDTVGNEAHHFGYTGDANRIFAGGLFTNRLFIYDVKTDPRNPTLIRTVPDLAKTTGYSGPHTFYAVPSGVMIAMLGGKTGGAPGGLVTLDNDGKFVRALAAPKYMYDVGVKPGLNLMISSSWAHPHSIKHGMAPMEEVGDEVVVWDFATGQILQQVHLDKAPLEIRWLHGSRARGGFVNCTFGNSVWYWDVAQDGKVAFTKAIQLPDGSLPADMRISYDDKFLFVSLFGGNAVHQYDITTPLKPTLVSTVTVPQAQMMKLTPDNQRLYISNSLLSNLDGKVPYRVRLINVGAGGMSIDPKFDVDFENLATGQGRPHDMLLK